MGLVYVSADRSLKLRRLARLLVVVLVAALVAQLGVTAASAQPSSPPEDETPGEAASDQQADGEPLVRPDVFTAQLTARQTDRRVEIASLTTATSRTFANPDGTFTDELHAGPERTFDPDAGPQGQWRVIDTTLVRRGGLVVPRVAAAELAFSGGGDGPAVMLEGDLEDAEEAAGRAEDPNGQPNGDEAAPAPIAMELNWAGVRLPEPELDGNVALYRDVQPGVDLELEALPAGYAKRLIVRDRPTEPPTWRFELDVSDDLDISDAEGGGLEVTDSDGEVVIAIDGLWMWGAVRDIQSDEPVHVAEVDAALIERDGTNVLEVTPDFAFLSDPDVTYPVTIDPTASLSLSGDTFVQSNIANTSQWSATELRVGTYDGGSTKARTLIRFNTGPVAGKKILSASMELYNFHSWSCTARRVNVRRLTSGFDSSTVWSTRPSASSTVDANPNFARGYSSSCAAGFQAFDVTGRVQSWADGAANDGLLLISPDETDNFTWKKFRSSEASSNRPKLTVTYNSYPTGVTSRSETPVSGGFVTDVRPTLNGKFNDPEGGSGRVQYRVYNAAGSQVFQGWGTEVVSGSNSPRRIPVDTLTHGASYTWQARGHDGSLYGPWSATRSITVDVHGPSAPTLSSSSHSSASTWYSKRDVVTSWTASSDSPAGVKGYAVRFNKTADSTPSSSDMQTTRGFSVTASSDGVWYLHVRPRDNANNWSVVTRRTIRIDTVGPAAPTISSSTHPDPKKVYKTAGQGLEASWTASTDAHSGVQGYAVAYNANPTHTFSSSATLQTSRSYSRATTTAGTWYLHVRPRDNANNWGTVRTFRFQIAEPEGPLEPTIMSTTHPDQRAWSLDRSFSASWQPPASGFPVVGYAVALDQEPDTEPNGPLQQTTSFQAQVPGEGSWWLHVRARDDIGTWGDTAHYRINIGDGRIAAPSGPAPWQATVDTEALTMPRDSHASVFLGTGALRWSAVDASIPGIGFDAAVVRTYDSTSDVLGLLGVGWRTNLDEAVVASGSDLVHVDGDGVQRRFVSDGNGGFLAPKGVYDELHVRDGGYELLARDDTTTWFGDDGNARSWIDANGNVRSVLYEHARPARICLDAAVCTDEQAAVTLAYDAEGLLAMANDRAGRVWSYEYDDGLLVAVTTPSGDAEGFVTEYFYDDADRLVAILDAADNMAVVDYDEDGRVEAITDPVAYLDDGPPTLFLYDEDEHGVVRTVEVISAQAVDDDDHDGHVYDLDSHGRLVAETDPLKYTMMFDYDDAHNLTREEDPEGLVMEMEYQHGELVKEIDPTTGTGREYVYDDAGNLLSETDELGYRTEFVYDDAGNLTTTTDPRGHTTRYSYDDAGNVIRVEDPLGGITLYGYDDAGNATSVRDPLGHTTTYEYNDDGEVVREQDPMGAATSYVYDDAGDLVGVTDPAGDQVSYVYDEFGNVTEEHDELGGVWETIYDELGRVIAEEDPEGNVEYTEYDYDGNLESLTDASGEQTSFLYDDAGRLVEETDAEGITTTYKYDAADRVVAVTDPTGTTTMDYDKLGQLELLIDPIGNRTEFVYDEAGQLIAEVDAEDNRTTYEYDAAGNLIEVESAGGELTTYDYDAAGQLIEVVDPSGSATTLTYDAAGQLVEQRTTGSVWDHATGVFTGGGSQQIALNLEAAGVVHAVVAWEGNGEVSLRLLDADGVEVAAGRPGGGSTTVVTAVDTDPGGYTLLVEGVGTSTWRVDHTSPAVRVDTLVYDAAGQVEKHTDASGTATFTYTPDGELETFELPDGTVQEFVFDAGGMLTSMEDATGVQQFGYDDAGRLTSSTMQDSTVTAYGYDEADNQVVVVRDGVTTEFGYDGVGALASRSDDTTAEQTLYASDDGVFIDTVVHASGLVDDEDVDALGQVTATVLKPSSAGAPSLSWGYEYDGNGNLERVTDTLAGSPLAAYGYDHLDRLTSQTVHGSSGPSTTSYTYDGVGNRVRVEGPDGVVDALHNLAGQIVSRTTPDGVWSYFHDARGHLVRVVGPNETVDRSFDADGRLVEVRGDTVPTVSFTYDAAGLRTAKTIDDTVIRYGWDHGSLVGGPRLASLLVDDQAAEFTYDPDGAPLTVTLDGRELVFRYDHRGSVIELTDATDAAAVVTYRYDAWGELLEVTGDPTVVGLNPYTLLGAYGVMHDAEVGLYQMGARSYDPTLGRFISPDPIDADEQVSPYAYADNNPLVKFDPDGHAWGRLRKIGRAAAKGAKVAGRFAWKHKTDIALTAAMFFPPTAAIAGAVRIARVGSMAYKGYKAYSTAKKVNTAVKAGRSASKTSRTAAKITSRGKSSVARASQSVKRNRQIGKAAEKKLHRQLGSRLSSSKQQAKQTPLGRRYPDAVSQTRLRGRTVHHEVKAGHVRHNSRIQRQIDKDAWLAKNQQVTNTWHFYRSPTTRKIGPDPATRRALRSAGINVRVHRFARVRF
jgi:RHS repeat-associated protein